MFYRTGFRGKLFAVDVRFQTSLKRLRFAEMALLGLPVAPDRSVADHLDDIIQAGTGTAACSRGVCADI